MSPFIYNLLVFSPLLFLAGGFLYLLDKNGRPPPPPLPPGEAREHEQLIPDIDEDAEGGNFEPDDEDYDDNDEAPFGEEEGEEEEEDVGFDVDPGEANHNPNADAGAGASQPNVQPAQRTQRTPRARVVSTKKARSLARRDQRRAYHEFLHSQAQQRSEAEAALREEEEARAFENARRRYLLEEEIAARREAERVARLAQERADKELEVRDISAVVDALRSGRRLVVLAELAEQVGRSRQWVEGVVKREGFLGVGGDGEVRMVTREGAWVSLDREAAGVFWKNLEEKGRMDWTEIRENMEKLLVSI